jgi:very-short-patch-repair endonuclease/predicted nucleic acid-binding Zn ribbon protein
MHHCVICQVTFIPTGISKTCSKDCSSKWKRLRSKEVMLAKYGVDHPSKVKAFKDKAVRNTDYKKVHQNLKATMQEIYGVDNAMKNQHVSKMSASIRWNQSKNQIYKDIRTHEWWEEHYINARTTISALCKKFNLGETIMTKVAREVGVLITNSKGVSAIEEHLGDSLVAAGFDVIRGDRKLISPKEIDLLIPAHQLAIEVNGLYWHSSVGGKTAKNYHQEKMKAVEVTGYRLLQFWDYELKNKPDLVLSMIMNACGENRNKIGARECEVVDLRKEDARDFLNLNHLQGSKSCSSALGLLHHGQLVSVATLGPSRYRKGATEILRFASLSGMNVVGGFSKLISKIQGTVISYSDNRYSQGAVYRAAGFDLIRDGEPTMWLTDQNYQNLKHRSSCWSLKTDPRYESSKTQIENMTSNFNLDIVYDAGQKTWCKCNTTLTSKESG